MHQSSSENFTYQPNPWKKWWDEHGKFGRFSAFTTPAKIREPERSAELAEFCGIMLGDGGISRYQVTVTLHREDDRDYSDFVSKLVERLFKVTPSIYHKKNSNADDLVISRIALVAFLTEKCGLVKGNKIAQKIDIPEWILESESYRIACIRGLFDTDGCVFNHRYCVKGKRYSYKKISFTSASAPLTRSIYILLKEFGFKPRLAGRQQEVRLESRADVQRYFSLVGSHNAKHLKRYKN